MKQQFLSLVFRLELFFIGAFLCKPAIFDYKGSDWGIERTLMLVVGISLSTLGIVISIPKITHRTKVFGKLEIFSRYFVQASLWCFLSLLVMELTLRVVIYNPPLHRDVTSWAGDIPGVHSAMLWGKEGYAITHYEKWGEIRTPFHDNKRDNNVIVLGDSQTECLQVEDDIKFTSFAETILRRDGYDADLHNLGRSGLAMADYVSWIPAYQSLYRPKVIVVELTEGDFIESFHKDQFNYFVVQNGKIIDLVQTYDLSSGFTQRARQGYDLASQIKGVGYQRWYLIYGTAGSVSKENTSPEGFSPELAEQQMKMLINASEGIPLIVVLLPSAPYISGGEIQMTDPAHEQLRELIKQYPGITLVDPLPEFQKLAYTGHLPRGFFNSAPDTGHLNKYGNEIVGSLLAKAIEQVLK